MCPYNNIIILNDHLKRKITNFQTIKKFAMNIYGEIIDSKCYRDNPVVLFPLQVEHQHNLILWVYLNASWYTSQFLLSSFLQSLPKVYPLSSFPCVSQQSTLSFIFLSLIPRLFNSVKVFIPLLLYKNPTDLKFG